MILFLGSDMVIFYFFVYVYVSVRKREGKERERGEDKRGGSFVC